MQRPARLAATLTLPLVLACAASPDAHADDPPQRFTERTEYHGIQVERLAAGLEHPWSVAFLPRGRFLVTERPGRLQRIDRDGSATRIGGLPDITARGQGGLLDVSLHPRFEENQLVYLSFSRAEGRRDTVLAVVRGRLVEDRLEDVEEIFVQNRASSPGRHYGSRIAWLPDGTLLLSIGDRGSEPMRAQDTRDHAGSLLRLNDDGTIPEDNPFVGNEDVLDAIYSTGHRNIQGLVVTPDGTVWATEHGPRGGDLLHRVQAGHNYGWPVVTQGLDYRTEREIREFEGRSAAGVTPHAHDFGPTLAPSGLAFVTSERFPRWEGNLLAGGLRAERIRRLTLIDNEVRHDEELLLQRIGRIRDVREGPDGHLYVLTDASDGALWRISPQ
ncbi:MAG: PQQ-dependent sugar dehydrogenase [Deltaproteobacteria bacterium]|nr:MAG: PQQ-dependent sugar dehydrogenase [Deltaproteobacteria bacterium]